MPLREFYADVLTSQLIFYGPASRSTDANETSTPTLQQGYTVTETPALVVDGYGAAAAESVARYLEEFYPSKSEFKAKTKAYVANLRKKQEAEEAAFGGMQALTIQVLKAFSEWRFYKATSADDQEGTGGSAGADPDTVVGGVVDGDLGMVVMRHDSQDGVTARFYFWTQGLAKARDPRDRQYAASEIEIIRQVGEGHPSEVYEVRTRGPTRMVIQRGHARTHARTHVQHTPLRCRRPEVWPLTNPCATRGFASPTSDTHARSLAPCQLFMAQRLG